LAAITESWNEFTFEDIQGVFHIWMERLIWVIANSGEYYQSEMVGITINFTGSRNSPEGSGLFYPIDWKEKWQGVNSSSHSGKRNFSQK
jgi:hypothetical protein